MSQAKRIGTLTSDAVSPIAGIRQRIRAISGLAPSIAAPVVEDGAADGNEETAMTASQVLGAVPEMSHQSRHRTSDVGHFRATVRAA